MTVWVAFRVCLLKPGAVPQNSDTWTEPLIVMAKNGGAGHRPNLYVNSKPVAWEDFDHVLKQELSRRRVWVVYIGGDDTVAWQDVVRLIDVARGDYATAYLITGHKILKRLKNAGLDTLRSETNHNSYRKQRLHSRPDCW